MAGASEEALNSGREILQVMSDANKLYLVPGGVGAGSNMKMVHQVLAGIHILGASEAMGFAAQLGLDAKTTAEKIIGSEAWTWMHENRLQRMVEEDWNPGASALTIILKDVVCCLYEVFSTNTDCLRVLSPLLPASTTSRHLCARLPNKSTFRHCCRATALKTTLPWSASTIPNLSPTWPAPQRIPQLPSSLSSI
jgi:hypothetical protein